MITSESPAIQIRSLRFGVNASFSSAFRCDVCERGFGVVVAGGGGVGGVGNAICVSISSSPERPITAWTAFRGRSSRSAWLTPARGPVRASATSRSQPSGLL